MTAKFSASSQAIGSRERILFDPTIAAMPRDLSRPGYAVAGRRIVLMHVEVGGSDVSRENMQTEHPVGLRSSSSTERSSGKQYRSPGRVTYASLLRCAATNRRPRR